ncbi:MAG: aminotransferase class V-fold PLP-dependent enzyme, partial [Flavobacterium sp.]
RGPRGTGFLFVSDKALKLNLAPLFLDMNGAKWTATDDYEIMDSAKRFEIWEKPCAAIIGYTEAMRYANNIGVSNIESYNLALSKKLRQLLMENENLRVLDEGTHLASIVTFIPKNLSFEGLQSLLSQNNIFYSVSYKSSALIDFTAKDVDWAARFSPHYFNTLEEMEKVAAVLT